MRRETTSRAAAVSCPLLFCTFLLASFSCDSGATFEGGQCDQANDCADGLWCIGRVCRTIPVEAKDGGPGPFVDAGMDTGHDGGGDAVTADGGSPGDTADDAFDAGRDAGDDDPDAAPSPDSSEITDGADAGGEDLDSGDTGAPPGWRYLSAGSEHSCAISTGGMLYCWGFNPVGQLGDGTVSTRTGPVAVAPSSRWSAVAAGALLTCAIRDDRSLWCWGDNGSGGLADGTNVDHMLPQQAGADTDWVAVVGGFNHACALKTDQSLWCWGGYPTEDGSPGAEPGATVPVRVGGFPGWTSFSTLTGHTCGIRGSGALYCWGDNSAGQLGAGDLLRHVAPVRIGADQEWLAVAVGSYHTCAVRADRTLWCWGDNSNGALGVDTLSASPAPVRVGSEEWLSVDAHYRHTCAVRLDHTLWCWGDNVLGQLGDGTVEPRRDPVRVGDGMAVVSAGQMHTCALDLAGGLWCWGSNLDGQIGSGGFVGDQALPVMVPHDGVWRSLRAGAFHSCGLADDGAAWCWGENRLGQVTGAPGDDEMFAVPAGGPTGLVTIIPGNENTAGLTDEGRYWCRGSEPPCMEDGALVWHEVAVGSRHACGIDPDGALWCWGSDNLGELGLGPVDWRTETFHYPTAVGTDRDWSVIAAADEYTAGVRSDGAVWLWGKALGRPSSVYFTTPVRFDAGAGIRSISAGANHLCAIDDAGAAWCIGVNHYGQLGDGSATLNSRFTRVNGDAWESISAGGQHTCAIDPGHRLWCWGANYRGQLGIGVFSDQPTSVPMQVNGGPWVSVSAGFEHTCALDQAGVAWCWGAYIHGQLGQGPTYMTTPLRLANPRD